MNKDDLEKLITEIFFDNKANSPVTLATGRGGMKETLHNICDALGIEYNWIGMRKAYRFLLRTGGVKKENGYYILS